MKKKILGGLGLIVIIGLAISSYFVFGSYSQGYRAGTVMKISKKGVMVKTWEGELNVGGLQDPGEDGMATTVWNFTVSEDSVVEKIESAVDQGKRVKLMYKEKFYQFDFMGDTKYFVYDVVEIAE